MCRLRNLSALALMLIPLIAFSPLLPNVPSSDALLETQSTGSDAPTDDAEIYAKNMGVSVEEALRRFHLQDVAGDLEAKISVGEAETFAGLWVEHTPEFRIVVLFTAKNADEIIEPYLTTEIMEVVDVSTTKISLKDLQDAQNELLSSLTNLKILAETEINIYENRIKLYVVENERARVDDAVQAGFLKLPVFIDVVTVPKMGNTLANIYGGLDIWCTSGFSVEDIIGQRGVTTAGHCPDSLMYNGIPLIYQNGHYISSYDIEYFTTPGFTVTNQFQVSTTGETRRVAATKSRDNQVVGGYVCKYGITSGYTCGYISSKNFSPPDIPNRTATFIRVNNTAGFNKLVSPGDSGGPWFLSTTAYGTTSSYPADDPNDAIYMAVNYFAGIGVSVVLAPVFADVPWDYWAWQDIERLYNAGITSGCLTNPLRYCPDGNITRAEMAVFLLKGIHGSAYNPPAVGGSTGFNDVPITHWAAAWIKQFALEGITAGCSATPPLYCPENNTTNAQMAIFLLRSKHGGGYTPPPVGGSTGFNDVPISHWAAAWIKQLAAEGISSGCGGGNFCPEVPVTRAQMAGLLVRTFNLP